MWSDLNIVQYPGAEALVGMEFEVMKVVRTRIA
jgi:hypothetical protein